MAGQSGVIGRLPSITVDWSALMQDTSKMMEEEWIANFNTSGHGRWPVLKKTGEDSHLGKPGPLFQSKTVSFDETSATVAWGDGIVYAAIHQFGGTIQHPGSDKLQAFEYEGHMIFTHYTKPHRIRIPKRSIELSKSSIDAITAMIQRKVMASVKVIHPTKT